VTNRSFAHLSDGTLLRDLAAHVARHRTSTATLIAYLAEVDARKLYRPAGYPSMRAFCVEQLGMSEDSAYKRIQAARAVHEIDALLSALADGRLNLSGVCLLAAHLTPENAAELLDEAAGKSKSAIAQLLARRFPSSEMLPMVEALPEPSRQLAPGQVESSAPGRMEAPAPPFKIAPIAPERFTLQVTISQSAHDFLRSAQALLSHQIPNGDLGKVLERALELAVQQLEKRKFAQTERPRPARQSSKPRTIPAHIRRAVRERDGNQCTFVSERGRRCAARERLEFDHIDPVGRGGEATIESVRLLCRAHNQYEAECAYGAEFMARKRQEAQAAAAERAAAAARKAAAQEKAQEVIPWLRRLGISAIQARQAAERCESIPDASLEDRVRLALSCFGPRTPARGRVVSTSAGFGL